MVRHHRFFTRDQLQRLGFTRELLSARHRLGRGGALPQPPWRPSGRVITSPIDLWEVEVARDDLGRGTLGPPVPVHLFLWSVLPPAKPYLTKLGGVPWRPASRPWPRNARGEPCTFVAQFCFADSRALVRRNLPGDVLLVFFADWNSWYGDTLHLEWSQLDIREPVASAAVPLQSLVVPQFSGVIYETCDYPEVDSRGCEGLEDGAAHFLVAETQATKIGRTSFFCQDLPMRQDQELLCTLSSVMPDSGEPERSMAHWPLLDLERHAGDPAPCDADGWSAEQMVFGDAGALYFLIDGSGDVRVTGLC